MQLRHIKFILIFLFGLQVTATRFFELDWSSFVSAGIVLLSGYQCFRAAKNTVEYAKNWTLLGLACLNWGLADLLWGVFSVVLEQDPGQLLYFQLIYFLSAVLVLTCMARFLKMHIKQWNTTVLVFDAIFSMFYTAVLAWYLLYHDLLTVDIKLFWQNPVFSVYFIMDFLIFGLAATLYFSMRNRRKSRPLLYILAGIVTFNVVDSSFLYTVIYHMEPLNGLINQAYSIPFVIFGFGALERTEEPLSMAFKPDMVELPNNVGEGRKESLMLLGPVILVMLKGVVLSGILLLLFLIIFRFLFGRLLIKSIHHEFHLAKKTALGNWLEQQIQEREKSLELAHESLSQLTMFDTITSLYNRAYIRKLIEEHIEDNECNPIHLLYMDIDRFKIINDMFGHVIGDKVLSVIGERLQALSSEQTLSSRLGGDEFMVTCFKETSIIELEALAENLSEVMEAPINLFPYSVAVTVSIGIVSYPENAGDAKSLFQNAEIAMYHVKKSHTKKYGFFDVALSDELNRRHKVEMALRQACFDEEFQLHYQPQFDATTREMTGVEALLRWQSKTLGPVSPAEFIPIAEESGLIVALGEWVLKNAIAQAAQWQRDDGRYLRMAINIAPQQLYGIGFIHKLDAELKAQNVAPQWIELEITENTSLIGDSAMEELLAELARCGISVAIDDFGTGYSSLSYIKRFDIACVKIDKTLIDQIDESAVDEKIVHAIISMAEAMGLRTVAEGVENESQLKKLTELGCTEIQGYYLGRPMRVEAFNREFANNDGYEKSV